LIGSERLKRGARRDGKIPRDGRSLALIQSCCGLDKTIKNPNDESLGLLKTVSSFFFYQGTATIPGRAATKAL
jgi:hypothetical protein